MALDAATQGGYVFSYRGPEELKAEAAAAGQSVDAIAREVRALIANMDVTAASGIEADAALAAIDRLLPGDGSLAARAEASGRSSGSPGIARRR